MADVAVVSVISGVAVALGVPLINAWSDSRKVEWAEPAFHALQAAVKEVWRHENRIAVRVGHEDPIFQHYVAASERVHHALFTFSAALKGETLDDDRRATIVAHRVAAIRSQRKFHNAAAELAGPRKGRPALLPSR